ncbi:transmembrane proteins 14C-domain-containing protein [Radiomyces spectabilis]|uniref:transmembrane proteins 14C-domain-containing protein n=1 Tax=Radiomyces spectabilis TaxID=64574 RepID=UPI002220120C|nr:transmembrane proteins 14C-domain-containing protein [Radiomyces spectabilis]KAI8369439.1 transmembrane proteins 14C-domain-containing protein [Radiomyces spectabilis]
MVGGSSHPSITMGLICTAGGIAGYRRTASVPSLVGGVGIGAVYGTAAYLVWHNKDYGHETALAASLLLAGGMVPRAVKSEFKKPVPAVLSVLSIAAGSYYAYKIYQYR